MISERAGNGFPLGSSGRLGRPGERRSLLLRSRSFAREGQSLADENLQPAGPPSPGTSSLEVWLTVLVFIAAGLVYLSLFLQSALVFVIGEGACVLLAPAVLWLERGRVREWWDARWKCPNCGRTLRGVKGPCPECGHKRIFE